MSGTHSAGSAAGAGDALDQTAIWLRLAKPSLVKMCWTWFCAVRSETYSASAICRLVSPFPTSRATSRSRGLSGADPYPPRAVSGRHQP